MKITLDGHKAFEKKFKIKFFKPEIHQHSNGFLSVRLDWVRGKKCEDDFYKFKYAQLAHRSYGGSYAIGRKKYINIVSASFEFEETIEDCEKFEITPWFSVCIGAENEEKASQYEYDYVFFENTKYGIVCWFAPKGWEDWNSATLIKD